MKIIVAFSNKIRHQFYLHRLYIVICTIILSVLDEYISAAFLFLLIFRWYFVVPNIVYKNIGLRKIVGINWLPFNKYSSLVTSLGFGSAFRRHLVLASRPNLKKLSFLSKTMHFFLHLSRIYKSIRKNKTDMPIEFGMCD